MRLSLVVFGLCLIHLHSASSDQPLLQTLYTLPTPYDPAFGEFVYNPVTNEIDYAFSSFTGRPNEPDKILRIPSVSRNFRDQSKMVPHIVTEDIVWPNEVNAAPLGAFNKYYWTSASAFFLPFKNNGSISLIDMTDPYNTGDPIPISPYDDGTPWYYHRVLWQDMDYDGDYDAITERAYGNATATYASQLVWFENPGTETVEPFWKTHIIDTGDEDVSFRIHNFPLPDGSETLVIVSAGFFSNALTITWTTDGDWSNPDSINHRVIDTYGWYFDLWIEDLNGDGMLDIVTSTWYRPGPRYFGSLVAYEMPTNWWVDKWNRHVISKDFRKVFLNSGNGSPGGMTAFWPSKQMELDGEKPNIILSGDDDGHAYMFVPTSKDQSIWEYEKSTILRELGTIGAIAVADIDNDGFQEIFVPEYSRKQISVMSYNP